MSTNGALGAGALGATAERDPFPYRKDAKIYCYGGHGIDLCDYRTRLPIIRIVPENCIYVTIAECGYKTFIQGGEEEFFRNAKTLEILRNIDLNGNKEIFANAMNRKSSWIHIHMPGTPYVASKFVPLLYWNEDRIHTGIGLSGLIDKELLETIGEKGLAKSGEPMYYGYVKKGSEIQQAVKEQTTFPVLHSKAIDMMKNHIHSNDDKYLQTRYDVDTVNKILRESSLFVTKDELLDYYAASAYPTREEIQGILETKFPEKNNFFPSDLTDLDEYIVSIMNPENKEWTDKDYPLSNTYMMKYFPGIHFNIVCREMDESCSTGLHRTLSGIQEAERQGFRYIFPPTKSFDEILGLVKKIVEEKGRKMQDKSNNLKKLLSDKATNLYVLEEKQQQSLYDYLLEKGFLQSNMKDQTANSSILKYYLMPKKYRNYTLGGKRNRNRKTKKQKTRKQKRKLSSK